MTAFVVNVFIPSAPEEMTLLNHIESGADVRPYQKMSCAESPLKSPTRGTTALVPVNCSVV